MALYGVLGDIHGNREALLAALAALEERGADRWLCVGDIVGYNADPDECARLVRERGALAIAGNHDLIGLGRLGFGRCSNKAKYSLKQTRRRLAGDTAAYLRSLPAHLALEDGVVLIHGGVRDVEQYMRTPQHIARNAQYARADFPGARVFLFGHTHEQKVYEVRGEEVRELPASGRVALAHDCRYFINPGSVDASRKREHRQAECALLDSDAWTVEYLRCAYDDLATERKAALGGYRIGPWTDRMYTLRNRVVRVGQALARRPLLSRTDRA